ncbi:MAG: VWA domain-containing protein, partial [Planctomycetes bacterium]|nr:VWA domain-containing protein [Planctomycetota bacterium]
MSTGMNDLTDRFRAILAQVADVQTLLRSTPPWLASLLIHLGVLVPLALISATMPAASRPIMVETRLEDNAVGPEFTDTLNPLDTTLNPDRPISESLSFAPAGVSVGQALGPPSFGAGTAAGRSFGSGQGAAQAMAALDLTRNTPTLSGPGGMSLPTGTRIDKAIAVLGSAAETMEAGGAGAAIDRLTIEINRSLDDRKTLVMWVLDATASLKPQREEIAQRIDRVYEELGVLRGDKQQQRALLTAVVEFGERHRILAEPTDDLDAIKSAMRSVKDDESGTENVFGGVLDSLRRWDKYRTTDRRNLMLIILTDEKGDDDVKVEETIAAAKGRAKVYVVGTSAPLGRPQVMLPWPSASQVLGYAPADRGPESVEPEREYLPFWSPGGAMLDLMPSGFGPWALTRLCSESGGIYFIMRDNSNFNYDSNTLRAYHPDYVPRKEYERRLNES